MLLDLAGPAHELARKIVVRTAEIGLSMRNLSSLSASEAAEVRSVIETDLRARGVRVVSPLPGAPELRLSLAENLQGLVWTAEAPLGTAILAVERSAPDAPAFALTIEKKLLLEQDEPILDVLLNGDTMLVLEPSRIVVRKDGNVQNIISIPAPYRPARDPRGRLALEGGAVRAQLFGDSCRAALTDAICPLSPGPSRFDKWLSARGKNFLSDGSRAYYSYAAVEDRGRPVTVFAGVDGRAYLEREPIETSWGSDIVGVASPCGGRIVFVTQAEGSDAIQAYRIADRRAVAVSQKVEFPGLVTALWSNGGASLAVSRDPATRKYAAYSLAIFCGR